jgi:hypothetical protein
MEPRGSLGGIPLHLEVRQEQLLIDPTATRALRRAEESARLKWQSPAKKLARDPMRWKQRRRWRESGAPGTAESQLVEGATHVQPDHGHRDPNSTRPPLPRPPLRDENRTAFTPGRHLANARRDFGGSTTAVRISEAGCARNVISRERDPPQTVRLEEEKESIITPRIRHLEYLVERTGSERSLEHRRHLRSLRGSADQEVAQRRPVSADDGFGRILRPG